MFSLLFICTYTDIKRRELSVKILIIYGVIGVLYYCILREMTLIHAVGGILIGALLLLIHMASKGAIGIGDGILLMVTGCFLGFRQNFLLLMGGLLLGAVYSIFLLILRKADRKKELPFVPFLLISYIGVVIL